MPKQQRPWGEDICISMLVYIFIELRYITVSIMWLLIIISFIPLLKFSFGLPGSRMWKFDYLFTHIIICLSILKYKMYDCL